MIYLGIESGSASVLKLVNKPVVAKGEIVQLIENCHRANIGVSVIFIVGLGGKEFSTQHLKESLDLIEQMKLDPIRDIIYLSKLVVFKEISEEIDEKIEYLSPEELVEEYSKFQLGIKECYKLETPKVANYDIREFIY